MARRTKPETFTKAEADGYLWQAHGELEEGNENAAVHLYQMAAKAYRFLKFDSMAEECEARAANPDGYEG